MDVLWSKTGSYCEESACDRLSFFESTPRVPRRARSTNRLRDQLLDEVIRSGRAVSETTAGFAVFWWMVRAAVTEACLLQLPDVDKVCPRMLGMSTGSGPCATSSTRPRNRGHGSSHGLQPS